VGGQPLVERDVEGEEVGFGIEGVDHLDVELGVFEGGVVEAADVVEEVSGEGGMRVDDGALEAEVVIVLGDLLVDGWVVDSDGGNGGGHGDLGALGAFEGEENAVEVLVGSGGEDVVVGGDELDAGVVEGEGAVTVVGDDDADGEEAVLDIGEAEEVAVAGLGAGIGGDGDVLVLVGVEGEILRGGLGGWGGLFLLGEGVGGDEEGCEEGEKRQGDSEARRGHGGSLIMIFAGVRGKAASVQVGASVGC